MYFPYLRGRQNELLCLRELLDAGKLSTKIIPIIEPVKFSRTFFSTLTKFIVKKVKKIKIKNFRKNYMVIKMCGMMLVFKKHI